MQTLRDTLLIFARQMTLSLRNPVWVILGLTQPILYLVLFGPLLERIAGTPGFPPGDAWQVFVPGLLVQLGLFGAAFVGFGLIAEWRYGVVERMRVTPVNRLALLLGRVLRDAVVLLVQAILLVVVAAAFGLRAPLPGILMGLGFVLLLAISLAALSYAGGLVTKDEDAFAPLVNSVSPPLLLLSGFFLPMSLAPRWLNLLSEVTPFRHIVDAMRAVFRGDYAGDQVLVGVAVAVALAVVSVIVGARVFARENA